MRRNDSPPKEFDVSSTSKGDKVPPPVISNPPGRDLEEKLKQNPDCQQAKVDVGSDESMDASDPPATSQPGSNEPVPSSGFPDKDR
jgi:hypothetical protein